jgi:hypothetical protein
VSSAILYIAIVAIWAFVLIPRWLRRPHLLGGETAEHELADQGAEAGTEDQDQLPGEATAGHDRDRLPAGDAHGAHIAAGQAGQPGKGTRRHGPAPLLSRSRVLQARRRLLTMLVTLAAVAVACTYFRLAKWWVSVPPIAMLGVYLLLLREAALVDADRVRSRVAAVRRTRPAHAYAYAEVEPEPTAEVIDLSARLGDQLYDQYADATIRAVGD